MIGNEMIWLLASLITGFILNIVFLPPATILDFLFGIFKWVIVVNLLIFLYREVRIYLTELEYRSLVDSVHPELLELEKSKPKEIDVNHQIPTVWKTNEDAYHQFAEDLKRLRENIVSPQGMSIVSEVSVKDEVSSLSHVIGNASYYSKSVFDTQTYRVRPEIEDWMMRHVFPTVDSAKEKVKFLNTSLEALQNSRMAIKKGVEGEMFVIDYLDDFKETLLPLYGVRFQTEKGTVENDIMLFTQHGIFSLEIKNIGSSGDKSIKISKDGLWYEKSGDYWRKSDRDKIFDQVIRSTALTEKLLCEGFGQDDKYQVKNIIVVPNKNLEIENESSFQIVRPNQIIPLIREMPSILTKEECEKLHAYVKAKDIGQAKFEHVDSKALVTEIIRVYESLIEDCRFLEESCVAGRSYATHINKQNLQVYRRLKYLNCDTRRSVL